MAATSASAAQSNTSEAPGVSKIRWETPNCNRTSSLVTYLCTHPADCRILFYEAKRSRPNDDSPLSGSDKGKIYAVIAKHIFEKDQILKGKYKSHRGRFKQTGAGVNPEDPGATVNLLAQVLNDFPWYEELDNIWKDNPAYAAKTFSSAPGTDRAGDLKALTRP
ncbi:hypothetical protein DFH29DRAFT_815849, partial [Suillus ampliporus]